MKIKLTSPGLILFTSILLCGVLLAAYKVHVRHIDFTDIDKPNIVLITIDTVRADHLGLYGYDRNTSPAISGLSRKGVVFKHAISQSPWTLPSIASIHTSKYPPKHGAIKADTAIKDGLETIAETLKKEGYYNIGIISAHFCGKKYGLAKGFDVFDESQSLGHDAITSKALTEIALDNLENAPDKPFFLWVHYFDPHYSYVRHPEFGFASFYKGSLPCTLDKKALKNRLNAGQLTDEDLEYIKAVYDEEIAYTDFWVGRLLDEINNRGMAGSTITIVTADHGEYFLERGRFFHGKDVYEELVHVPLVISGAINKEYHGSVVNQSVEISSIAKTIMELVKVEDHGYDGENLLTFAHKTNKPQFVFSYGCYAWGQDERKTMAVYDKWKLIRNLDDDSYELYNLNVDKKEENDLWQDASGETAAKRKIMKQKLDEFASKKIDITAAVEIDKNSLKRLESLGYVQ